MDWGSHVTYIGSTTLKEKTVNFGIKDNDRLQHFCILGRAGTGRGDMVATMALQDIERGVGVVFLDATGTSAPKLLERIDPSAMERVVYVDPADAEYPCSWNIVDDIKTFPKEERAVLLEEVLAEVYALSPSPFLKEVADLLLMHDDTTLITLYSLVTDEKFRDTFFENNERGQKKFTTALHKVPEVVQALEGEGAYIAKDTLVRNILCQQHSKFTLNHLPEGQIVIVDFSHIRMYPTRMAPLVRLFVLAMRIVSARSGVPAALYMHDTLRYLSEPEIERLFKPHSQIAVTLADTIIQETDTERRKHALSRCGSVASFASHSADKEILEKAFYPFMQTEELVRLEPTEFIVALTIDGVRENPFFARALPLPPRKNVSLQDILVRARRQYTTVRTKVDATFKSKKDDDNDVAKKPPGNFQDAFRSIFAKQAERAQQNQPPPAKVGEESKKRPEVAKKETKEEAPAPPEKKEVSERTLRTMLYVAPISILLFFLAALPTYAQHAVNINTADLATLTTVTGIGEVIGGRIITYRQGPDGPFDTVEEISAIQGIGEPGSASYEKIKDHIVVSATAQAGGTAPSGSTTTFEEPAPASAPPPPSASMPLPKNIFIDVGQDRTVFVGADSVFGSTVTGLSGEPLEKARVVWTFGNGDRKEGQRVVYNFAYPGTYVVVADAASGLYSATDRIIVTAIPAALAVTDVTAEYIALKNNSSTEIDLGGWMLFSAGTQFQFPARTILLPNQEVLVSNARTGLSGANPGTVALQYPNGLVATAYEYPLFLTRSASSGSTPQGRPAPAGISSAQPEDSSSVATAVSALGDDGSLITAPVVARAKSASAIPDIFGWLVALFAVIGIAVSGIVFSRGEGYKEYSIKEIR